MKENEMMVQEEATQVTETACTNDEAKKLTGAEKGLLVSVGILAIAGGYHVVSKTIKATKKGIAKIKKAAAKKSEEVSVEPVVEDEQ